MKPKILLLGGKAESGKDSAANILKRNFDIIGKKSIIIHFADLLKFVCKSYLGWDGEKDEKGRNLLQKVGTEEFRTVYPTFWADFVVSILNVLGYNWQYVIIPDFRFPNECSQFEEFGYEVITVKIERIDHENILNKDQKTHSSEIALNGFDFDFKVSSLSGLNYLEESINSLFNILIEEESDI